MSQPTRLNNRVWIFTCIVMSTTLRHGRSHKDRASMALSAFFWDISQIPNGDEEPKSSAPTSTFTLPSFSTKFTPGPLIPEPTSAIF